MNEVIKVKDYKQKPKGACPAQTEADRELQPKITTSCPACSNTFVVGSAFLSNYLLSKKVLVGFAKSPDVVAI